MNSDEKWMSLALEQAKRAEEKGEVPIGAVIVQDNKVIAKAHNCPISKNDPTAHAEILALRMAGKKIQNYRLPETSLYVTLEPCLMCIGAINHARINRVIFGAPDSKNKVLGSSENLILKPFLSDSCSFDGGILEEECKEILQSFFKLRRKNYYINSSN
ncbi:tRNA adenosine(34) deaminase TadA [bacterium]|nr:tRNA adenosine(34) deaminase TadA [bacterium]